MWCKCRCARGERRRHLQCIGIFEARSACARRRSTHRSHGKFRYFFLFWDKWQSDVGRREPRVVAQIKRRHLCKEEHSGPTKSGPITQYIITDVRCRDHVSRPEAWRAAGYTTTQYRAYPIHGCQSQHMQAPCDAVPSQGSFTRGVEGAAERSLHPPAWVSSRFPCTRCGSSHAPSFSPA